MTKLNKYLITLLLFCGVVVSQEEQAGIDLAASFPQFTEGNVEPDLPADGNYWDQNNSGWGLGIEVQARKSSPSGYFLFGTVYSYKEDGTPFWCAFSAPYEHEDVNQWRDAKGFSNLKYGHNQQQVLSDMSVDCLSFRNGTPIKSNTHKNNEATDTVKLHLVWRTPTKLEVTAEGGQTHYTQRMAWYDDLLDPSLDWIMDTNWAIMSNVVSFSVGADGNYKATNNYNVNTGFERLNADEQQNLKDFVGHQANWEYYISTVKSSITGTIYRDFETVLGGIFTPDITVGFSNVTWIVLIYDPSEKRVMLFTVAGDKQPGELRPDAGVNIKFVANVDHDSDVLDFYAYHCEGLPGNATVSGFGEDCNRNELSWDVSSMADWSPQNVHRSSMKMLKLRTGGEGYMFQKNNGESHNSAELRIEQQLIDKGILPE